MAVARCPVGHTSGPRFFALLKSFCSRPRGQSRGSQIQVVAQASDASMALGGSCSDRRIGLLVGAPRLGAHAVRTGVSKGKPVATSPSSPITHPFEDVDGLPAAADPDQHVKGRASHGVVDRHHRAAGDGVIERPDAPCRPGPPTARASAGQRPGRRRPRPRRCRPPSPCTGRCVR